MLFFDALGAFLKVTFVWYGGLANYRAQNVADSAREATALVAALESPDVDLHAPSLCDIEVAAAIRTALLLGHVGTLDEATAIVGDLVGLPIERYEHGPLLDRILELRDNFSAYDASYVALAEALGVSLLTADLRLAAATRAHTGVNVHLTSTG